MQQKAFELPASRGNSSTSDRRSRTLSSIASKPVPGVYSFWTYTPSEPSWSIKYRRFKVWLAGKQSRPPFKVLKMMTREPLWVVYFMYCPGGIADGRHEHTLTQLRHQGFPVLCVCATPKVEAIPEVAVASSDALVWKGVGGYDFSAYRIGLELICESSAGARVMCLNDSMLGPFFDLRPFIEDAPWDLTGFTASALHENHIQSYGFIFSRMDPGRLSQLNDVFLPNAAYDDVEAVILNQENKLARVASASMSVGAYWYCDGTEVDDACLRRPLELLDAGFPFLKRSLLGKMMHFQDPVMIRNRLRTFGYPGL